MVQRRLDPECRELRHTTVHLWEEGQKKLFLDSLWTGLRPTVKLMKLEDGTSHDIETLWRVVSQLLNPPQYPHRQLRKPLRSMQERVRQQLTSYIAGKSEKPEYALLETLVDKNLPDFLNAVYIPPGDGRNFVGRRKGLEGLAPGTPLSTLTKSYGVEVSSRLLGLSQLMSEVIEAKAAELVSFSVGDTLINFLEMIKSPLLTKEAKQALLVQLNDHLEQTVTGVDCDGPKTMPRLQEMIDLTRAFYHSCRHPRDNKDFDRTQQERLENSVLQFVTRQLGDPQQDAPSAKRLQVLLRIMSYVSHAESPPAVTDMHLSILDKLTSSTQTKLNPKYVKALLRTAQCVSEHEKLEAQVLGRNVAQEVKQIRGLIVPLTNQSEWLAALVRNDSRGENLFGLLSRLMAEDD